MAIEFTQEVSSRLEADHYAWLTTVAKSGQPVPRLVWFYFDGTDVFVYSMPEAGKVRHIANHARVSVNLDSDGNGAGIIVVGGDATVDATDSDPRDDGGYWKKYQADAERFGLADAMGEYSTRLKVSIDRVWTTPTGG
jgi:PPOX class probable F420-dependent enzyme